MSVWIHFAAAFLGLWLLASPATFGYTNSILIGSDLLCGALLLIVGIGFRRCSSVLPGWGYALIGFWLNVAPLLFWAPEASCYLNNTVVGILLLGLFIALPAVPNQLPNTGPSVPPGWTYNPSSWPQRLPIIFLGFICWSFSRYLAAYQLGYIHTIWDPFFGDGTLKVITSDVSKQFPVPDAGLGALAYSLEFIFAFGSDRRWRTTPWLTLIFGILAVPSSLVSILLIILQPTVVGAWCTLCLATAFLMLIIIALSLDEVAAVIQFLRSKEKPFLKLLFFGGKCPGSTEDKRTPTLDAPLPALLRASRWGVTVPWNLALSSLAGIALMFLPGLLPIEAPMSELDPIIGALIVVASFIAMADVTRRGRWLIIPLSLALCIGAFVNASHLFSHICISVVAAFCAPRKGPFSS